MANQETATPPKVGALEHARMLLEREKEIRQAHKPAEDWVAAIARPYGHEYYVLAFVKPECTLQAGGAIHSFAQLYDQGVLGGTLMVEQPLGKMFWHWA
ncbi:MAG: hypothetical protein RL150_428 [Candidatus Parcubacteria bacterium]|jgi:hypothetical protein